MATATKREFTFNDTSWHEIPLISDYMIIMSMEDDKKSYSVNVKQKILFNVSNSSVYGGELGDGLNPLAVDYPIYIKCDTGSVNTPYTILVFDVGA